MSLHELNDATTYVVGTKQTIRAIAEGQAKKVFLAKDADRFLQTEIEKLCQENQISIEGVSTMLELGRHVGIEVKAAVATIIGDEQ
ncbi:ribosomal L7Ae/L30e/S12e/Gadd45 family protein [Clostridia bacterium]|nr:ribosomal L7Ae/L30e/S12e/Gadd45 family protein [Clostridia bacterium]